MNLYRSLSILVTVFLLSSCSVFGESSTDSASEKDVAVASVEMPVAPGALTLSREQREAELQKQGLAELLEAEAQLRAARVAEQRVEQQRESRRLEEELRRQQLREERLERERQLAQNAEDQGNAEELEIAENTESAIQRQDVSQEPVVSETELTAAQQAEISTLEAQIEANNVAAERLASSNDALQEAISVAGELSAVLNTEGQKYTEVNSETGLTSQKLDKDQIAELVEQVKQLRAQASRLASQNQ